MTHPYKILQNPLPSSMHTELLMSLGNESNAEYYHFISTREKNLYSLK